MQSRNGIARIECHVTQELEQKAKETSSYQGMRNMGDWNGQHVVVIGAARQGIALVRYLIHHGATVVLNDRLPLGELKTAQQALVGEPVVWVCGEHPLSLLEGADLVCPSGGVPLTLPLIVEAQRRGIPLSNDSQIFLESAPCPVVGITGSAGKTTTTTLVGRMAEAAIHKDEDGRWEAETFHFSSLSPHPSRVWVGGNIGSPLIAVVDEMKSDHLAVMEISSFQLEGMQRAPQIAAVLNVTPNHLDRHSTMAAYKEAKSRILKFQSPQGIAILNHNDPGAWDLREEVRGRLLTFGITSPPPGQSGAFLMADGQTLVMKIDQGQKFEIPLLDRKDITLRGDHNLQNVLAACAIACAVGLPSKAILNGVHGFNGVPHRLEFVRSWGGADWYNDSIATAPERAMAAIKSFHEPLVILAGGRDKNLPWDEFATLVARRVKHVVLFGEAADKIAQAILVSSQAARVKITHCAGLHEAVMAAAEVVSPGDVVLLAPGGTSFDQYRDFEDRGEAFRRWVMKLP